MSELSESEDTCNYYTISQKDLLDTSLPNWYPNFASVTIKTKILEIPTNVLEYLRSESMRLPLNTESSSFSFQESHSQGFHDDDDDDDDDNDNDNENIHLATRDELRTDLRNRVNLSGLNGNIFGLESDESSSEEEVDVESEPDENSTNGHDQDQGNLDSQSSNSNRQSRRMRLSSSSSSVVFEKFEVFDGQIKRAIDSLNGSAFPKINWKSPKDAMWIAFNRSLRSYLPGDIYLTLKSSTNVYNVLHEPFKDSFNYDGLPCQYYLCLRQWTDIDPATEFRCFVHDGRLICISQRETSGGYEKIPAQRDAIIQDVYEFFRTKIYGKFTLNNYVFDVARPKPGKVLLVDFNVFGLSTDPLLFTYREIKMVADEMDSRLKENGSSSTHS